MSIWPYKQCPVPTSCLCAIKLKHVSSLAAIFSHAQMHPPAFGDSRPQFLLLKQQKEIYPECSIGHIFFSAHFSKSLGLNSVASCLHSKASVFKLQKVSICVTFALKFGMCSIVFLKFRALFLKFYNNIVS